MRKNILKKISLIIVVILLLPTFNMVLAEKTEENMKTSVFMDGDSYTYDSLFYEQNGIEDVFLNYNKEVLDKNTTISKNLNVYVVYSVSLDIDDLKLLNSYYEKSDVEKPKLSEKANKFILDLENIKNYSYNGVLFDFSHTTIDQNYYDEFIKLANKSVDASNGLRLNKDNEKIIINEEDIKVLMPNIDVVIEKISGHLDFTHYVNMFLKDYENINLYFPVTFKKVLNSETVDTNEITTQLFYLKNKGVKNVVFDTNFSLIEDQSYFSDNLKHWFTTANRDVPDILKELSIGRPSKNITVTSKTYNVFGTSNPNEKLYVNGVEVENRGEKGTFAYLSKLEIGDNPLTFSQTTDSKTVVITRIAPAALAETIDVITKKSMLPTLSDYAYSGGEYNLKCVAPSGATVTAEIDGVKTELKQQAITEKNGTPAVYRGIISFDNVYNENEIKNIGKVKYKLTFNGVHTEYESQGDLYIAGMDTVVGAKSISPMANLYDNLDDVKNYKYSSTLSIGQWDEIVDATEDFFKLSMGDYIKKNDVTLIDINKENKGKLLSINYTFDEDSESILLEGIKDNINSVEKNEDGSFKFTIYNVDVTGFNINKAQRILAKGIEKSKVFETGDFEIVTNEEENHISIILKTKENKPIWGYEIKNIESKRKYSNNVDIGTLIYFKKNPIIEGVKPLQGKLIILDPGHGGYDPGALGTAYEAGPVEKDLSLKTALKTKEYLEEQGAEVFLIRNDDTFIPLQERAIINEKIKPDVFVSIHLNSVAETSDSESHGAEVYYYNENSKLLSENILKSMESKLDRNIRGAKEGAYVVARPTIAPSVLCEIGFMSNPQEYENMTEEDVINKTGLAIADGIKNTVIQGSLI